MLHNEKAALSGAALLNDLKKRTRNPLDFKTINHAALGVLPALLHRWLLDGRRVGGEFVAKNPRRTDNRAGSFSINLTTGRWADFATGDRGGDVVSLLAYSANVTQGEAAHRLALMLGVRHES